MGPPSNVFFQLVLISWMATLSSSLNELCIRLNNAGDRACDRLTEDDDFGNKNHLFRWTSFWVNRHNCRIWGTENPHGYIEKPTHPKRVTVWCWFCWTNFSAQKLKSSILATFGFNRTALRATQPNLHSMFGALFLKITLSAAVLMSFGYLELRFETVGLLFVGCRQR